jgi:hypothetical protein
MNESVRIYLIYCEAYRRNPSERNYNSMVYWFIRTSCGKEYADKVCYPWLYWELPQ